MIARLKNILTSVSIEHCTSIIKRIKALKGKGRVAALGKYVTRCIRAIKNKINFRRLSSSYRKEYREIRIKGNINFSRIYR